MRIVLRNKGRGRVDAVYVLDVTGFATHSPGVEPSYWLYAYWGKWEKFAPTNVALGLQSQLKYQGSYKADVMAKVQKLVAEKMDKGYQVQEEYSRLPEWPILPHGQDWREEV